MSKFYVIIPVFFLIVFGVYYSQVAKPQMEAQVQAKEQQIQKEKDEEEAHRKEIETKAAEDARKAQAARDEKEKQRLDRLQRQKEEQDRLVRDETAKYENEAAKLSKDIAAMELQIADLRNKREATNRDVLELSKKVELAKIDRRNAELEIQRMYDMVAQKIDNSFLARMPPPPPAK